ncbi:hypothetical protein VE02_05136 [Pseudogymnoascus sp. 03VT05]|nr:hypothetical protein VE02_05136 [Pseudogymnoascus sp. 03VT05]
MQFTSITLTLLLALPLAVANPCASGEVGVGLTVFSAIPNLGALAETAPTRPSSPTTATRWTIQLMLMISAPPRNGLMATGSHAQAPRSLR